MDYVDTTATSKIYRNNEIDGYGGFAELVVPKDFAIAGTHATEEFKAEFRREVYSELGRVASVKFAGECERTNN